jgi:hypothetical protein
MKRVRIQSVEDLEALPEQEWVEVVGGMKFRWANAPMRVEGPKLVVPLPANVRKQFKARKGESLRATVTKSELIVVHSNALKPRQRSRKRGI